MSNEKIQEYRNHASFDPAYHFVGAALLLFNFCLGIILLVLNVRSQLLLYLWIAVLPVGLILLFLKVRSYPLKIQDRVIRLEERLRLQALLPDPLKARIPELTESQLIGLRFASDAELPALVAATLEQSLDRKQIKERIQNWRPDHFRI